MNEAEVSSLVEKYDQESRYRRLSGWQGKFATFWLAAMSLFHLYTAGITAMPITIQRAIHLTFAIVAVYVLYPATRRGDKLRAPWYDWLLAAAAGSVVGYIAVFFNEIARRGAEPLGYEIFLGVAAILLVIEAGRRVVRPRAPVPQRALPALLLLRLLRAGDVPDSRIFSEQDNTAHVPDLRGHLRSRARSLINLRHSLYNLRSLPQQKRRREIFQRARACARGRKPGRPRQSRRRRLGAARHDNGSSVANVATTGTFTITAHEKGRIRTALRWRGRSLRLDREAS